MFLLSVIVHQGGAEDDLAVCVRSPSTTQFADIVKDRGEATVYGGNGVVLLLSAADQEKETPGPSIGRRMLTVIDKGRKVRELPKSFYVSSNRVERNSTVYWAIEEYSGGMHCCNRHHFFARPGVDNPINYLGSTEGTMNPLESPWVCEGKDLYFEDSDTRFVYFHIDYAHSRLYIPRFHRLTPSSTAVTNRPFKDIYRDEIAEVNGEIGEKARSRTSKPFSILSGGEAKGFSDDLGQLLVQKTILHLFAREDQKAWQVFSRDVKSYYKTLEGVGTLRKEIERLLKKAPY
jgi:hypothetical protein